MRNVDLPVARKAGLAHLALAICGIAGFLVIRGRLVDNDDAAAAMANLISQPSLARAGLAAMLLRLEAATWTAGGLFFGLWLLPMDWLTIRREPCPQHCAGHSSPAVSGT